MVTQSSWLSQCWTKRFAPRFPCAHSQGWAEMLEQKSHVQLLLPLQSSLNLACLLRLSTIRSLKSEQESNQMVHRSSRTSSKDSKRTTARNTRQCSSDGKLRTKCVNGPSKSNSPSVKELPKKLMKPTVKRWTKPILQLSHLLVLSTRNRRPSSKNVQTQNSTRNSRKLTPTSYRKPRLLSDFRFLLRTRPRKVNNSGAVWDRRYLALSMKRWRRRERFNTSWSTVSKQINRRTANMTGQTVSSSGRKFRWLREQSSILELKVNLTLSRHLLLSSVCFSPNTPQNKSTKLWRLVS